MRPHDEVRCAVPRCHKSYRPEDDVLGEETGVCPEHMACVKCHTIGTLYIYNKPHTRNKSVSTPYVKCSKCDHHFPLQQYADIIVFYWSSLMGVLHRHGFDWYNGHIVADTIPPQFLKFETEYHKYWGRVTPTSADPNIDQVFKEVPTDWIAQDLDFIYVPYKNGRRIDVKKYLRDVRRYVPTFIVVPVGEVTFDTGSSDYKETRSKIDAMSVNGEKK